MATKPQRSLTTTNPAPAVPDHQNDLEAAHPLRPRRVFLLGRVGVGESGAAEPQRLLTGTHARALFARLVLPRNPGVPEGVLAHMLWPDLDSSTSVAALELLVERLNTWLVAPRPIERVRPEDMPVQPVTLGGQRHLRIHPRISLWVDADTMVALHAFGCRCEAEGDHEGARSAFLRAAALFRGDLGGGALGEWADPIAGRLRRHYEDVCQRLGDTYTSEGSVGHAIAYYQAILNEKPGRTDVWEKLVHLLMRAGRPGQAAHVLLRYTSLYTVRLGRTLPLSIRRLADDVLAGVRGR